MKYLYIDNFRGFTDTVVPIADVNFFVGENSTGKSSILGLINLLASPDFWLSQKFSSGDVQFGNFSDIVSVNSVDKSYFSIGLVMELAQSKDNAQELIAFQFTFVEREGLPIAGFYAYARNGREYRLRIGPRQIKFKTREVNTSCRAVDFTSSTFQEWKKAFREDRSGYTVAPDNIFAKSHNPPVFLAKRYQVLQSSIYIILLDLAFITGVTHCWGQALRFT